MLFSSENWHTILHNDWSDGLERKSEMNQGHPFMPQLYWIIDGEKSYITARHIRLQKEGVNGLVQDCGNSSALALDLLQSCTKPLIWTPEIQCRVSHTAHNILVTQYTTVVTPVC